MNNGEIIGHFKIAIRIRLDDVHKSLQYIRYTSDFPGPSQIFFADISRSISEMNEGLHYLTCMQFSYSKSKVKKKHLCSY